MRPTYMNLRIDEYNLWVKDVIRWQNSNFDINICLMDLYCLLQSEKIERVKDCSYEITNDLFSLRINNNKVNIVRQSNFPEIQELTAYLQYFYKLENNFLHEKKIDNDTTSIIINLFSEIAIILAFDVDIILVEEKRDIKKVEVIRDFISKLNSNFKANFKIPIYFLPYSFKILGLNGDMELKNNNCLLFSDSQNSLKKKIFTAKTDSDSIIRFDIRKKPEISNLINLYQHLTNETYDKIEDKFNGKKYADFKNALIKRSDSFLRVNYKKKADKSVIEKIFTESYRRTNGELKKRIKNIKKIIGISN